MYLYKKKTMKKLIQLGEKSIVLISKDVDEMIDMDDLTKIDYTNVYGEIVTCSVLLNKIGLLRAEAESTYNDKKLQVNIFEAKLRRSIRREAILNNGRVNVEDEGMIKLTEACIDDIVLADIKLQAMKKDLIESKKDWDFIESLFWSIKSKDSKLNALVPRVTPQEFFDELIEGKINTITIKKIKE